MLTDLINLIADSGFFYMDWKMLVMWAVIGVLFYLAVHHQFEPLLLIPIAFGALLANLPTNGVVNKPAGDLVSPVEGYVQYIFLEKGSKITLPRVVKDQPDALWRLSYTEDGSDFQEQAQAFFKRVETYTAQETKPSELPEFKPETASDKFEGAKDMGQGIPTLAAIIRENKTYQGGMAWRDKTAKVTFFGREIEVAPKDSLVWVDASGEVADLFVKNGSPIGKYLPIATLANPHSGGLYYYIQKGVLLEIFPPLIFLGVGALTDFGPLIANPRTLLLGAAAQFGVFFTFFMAIVVLGFTPQEAASIGIIGGADGPTSIFLSNKLAPHLMAPIAVAAYSYMALVPVIQPPVMRALTTMKERKIRMKSLRKVSRLEKLIFAVFVTIFCIMIVPDASALIGMLFFGNFIRESGVCERLNKCAQNELINIVTIFLGSSVGITMTGERAVCGLAGLAQDKRRSPIVFFKSSRLRDCVENGHIRVPIHGARLVDFSHNHHLPRSSAR